MKRIHFDEYARLRMAALLLDTDVCDSLSVNPRTVRRWRSDGVPVAIVLWLHLLSGHGLGAIHESWSGWSISRRDGLLYSPEGTAFSMGEIRAFPLQYAKIRLLQKDVRELNDVSPDASARYSRDSSLS